MFKKHLCLFIHASVITMASLIPASFICAQPLTLAQIGESSTSNIGFSEQAFSTLLFGPANDKQKMLEMVRAAPERYAPTVFYVMSQALFQDGKKDDAAFWFYAGQLRARFDANRCLDITARSAVGALNQQFGMSINQYMFANLPKLESLILQVVEWDRKTPHKYDHRWINTHGLNSIGASLGAGTISNAQSSPETQWTEIAEKTRTDYVNGFQQALIRMKNK